MEPRITFPLKKDSIKPTQTFPIILLSFIEPFVRVKLILSEKSTCSNFKALWQAQRFEKIISGDPSRTSMS